MAVSLDNLTIAYEASRVSALLSKIKIDVITKAADEIKRGADDLKDSIDTFWVGESADKFKKNIDTDTQNVAKALDKLYDTLEGEINTVTGAMHQVDEQLINER